VINNENILSHKDYTGGCIYNEDELEQIMTDEGVVVPKDCGGFQYQYFITDHLGNTRIMFTKNGDNLEILQENHYYPFGLKFTNQNSIPPFVNNSNKYLYNGKELQDDCFTLGGPPGNYRRLDWYDYGFRMQDPQLGRWHCVDKLAEIYNSGSPYAYVSNNPVNYIDPNGLWRVPDGIRYGGWVIRNPFRPFGNHNSETFGGFNFGRNITGPSYGTLTTFWEVTYTEITWFDWDPINEQWVETSVQISNEDWKQTIQRVSSCPYYPYRNEKSNTSGKKAPTEGVNVNWDYNFGVNKGTLQDFVKYYNGWHIKDIRKDVMSGTGEGIHFVYDMKTGKFLDMKHMLIAGRYGNFGGLVKEFLQLFTTPGSAFNKQDLFSNNLGNFFYQQYGFQLMFYPTHATEYLNIFLSAPKIFRYSPIPYKF
jgi:RHS repeat-associated protein